MTGELGARAMGHWLGRGVEPLARGGRKVGAGRHGQEAPAVPGQCLEMLHGQQVRPAAGTGNGTTVCASLVVHLIPPEPEPGVDEPPEQEHRLQNPISLVMSNLLFPWLEPPLPGEDTGEKMFSFLIGSCMK